MGTFLLKRAYKTPHEDDGFRVLVDRLWPRGIKKEQAFIDIWLKDIAPSNELRKWFGHKPERFEEFSERYESELKNNPAVDDLRKLAKEHDVITLVYSAKDQKMNQAVVLKKHLEG